MITYEEFMKKNNIKELVSLYFGQEEMFWADVTIKRNPKEYIDIAKQSKELKHIFIEIDQNNEYYESITEFIKNCNEEIKISNGIVGSASKEDYIKGEEKIKQILEEINPEWTTKQKLAYVHYKMGEIISYVPDFNFSGRYVNSPIANDARNIWKSISTGRSVCNGIADIQRNILSRLGIKTKDLSSGTHSFVLAETEEGNIIMDPTWDLSNTLYKARPQYFGVTYEELREAEEGLSNAHKLENPPENVIGISDEELREIYHSIGLTNEDRTFLFPLFDDIQNINEKEYPKVEAKIDDFFNMFSDKYSNEALHLFETRTLLETAIHDLGIQREQITSKFVYTKEDEDSEEPQLIFHINSEGQQQIIRMFDTEEMRFKNVELREFDENYKVHDLDTTEPFWKQYIQEREGEMQKEQENQK